MRDIPWICDGGRRHFIGETFRGTRKDAERVLRERLTAIENGGYIESSKETVAQFLSQWLQTYAASNTTLRTQMGYRGQILRYIDPAIGDMSLQSPTPQHVQGLYSALLERGLSGSTVLHVHRLIRQALSHAVKWRLCIRNVVDATTPPRPQRRQSRTWDVDTIHRFLKAANGSLNKDWSEMGEC